MDKINKLTLPVTILMTSIILGGFFYASQVSKQRSIEKQQQVEIENKKQEQLSKELKEQQAKDEAERREQLNTILLDTCLNETVNYYNNNIENYCKDYVIKENCRIPQETVNIWLKNQKLLRDECFKKYPQN